MTCEDRRDIIFLYAAGALGPAEQEELRAHLSTGCAACAGTVAEAQASLAELPLALPAVSPPSEARERLMSRIASSPDRRISNLSREPARPRAGQLARWSIISAITGLAAGIVITFALIAGQNSATSEKLAQAEARLKDVDLQLTEARTAVQLLNAEKLQLVSLSTEGAAPNKPNGRIIYDESNRLWHVRVFDLKPLPKDKTYELWFITPDQKKIRAGTFNTDERGSGTMMVQIPRDIPSVAVAAITDEPAGGVDAPTGSIQLAGKVESN